MTPITASSRSSSVRISRGNPLAAGVRPLAIGNLPEPEPQRVDGLPDLVVEPEFGLFRQGRGPRHVAEDASVPEQWQQIADDGLEDLDLASGEVLRPAGNPVGTQRRADQLM